MSANGKAILSGGGLTLDSLTFSTGSSAFDSSGNLAVGSSKLAITASSGNLTTPGNISTTGSGTLTVAGASTLTGNVTASGTLAVTGATTLTGLLTANGGIVGGSSADIAINSTKFTVAASTGNTVIAGTCTITGALTQTGALTGAAAILSTSATGGVGYGTGAGGAVTQSTDKTTGVTLNKACGTITLNNASLAAATSVGFTLTNSVIAATDVVVASIKSGATSDSYTVTVDATAAGSCRISLRNVTAGVLVEAVVLNYVVIKGVAA